MGVKVAAACFQWAQSPVPHPPSSFKSLVSTVSSPSLKRRSFSDGALVFRYIQKLDPSTLFGSTLYRSKSTDHPKPRAKTITRACSENLDAFLRRGILETASRIGYEIPIIRRGWTRSYARRIAPTPLQQNQKPFLVLLMPLVNWTGKSAFHRSNRYSRRTGQRGRI